jgi:hypothetical protein
MAIVRGELVIVYLDLANEAAIDGYRQAANGVVMVLCVSLNLQEFFC